MKKVITAALLLGTLGFASCTKSFTCECSYDNNGTRETISSSLPGVTKVDAKATCSTQEASLKSGGFADASCSIK